MKMFIVTLWGDTNLSDKRVLVAAPSGEVALNLVNRDLGWTGDLERMSAACIAVGPTVYLQPLVLGYLNRIN